MSDGITDSNRMTRNDIEIWRQRTKEEFVHNLTTQELVDELSKREGATKYDVPDDERIGYAYITPGKSISQKVWGKATILVMKE